MGQTQRFGNGFDIAFQEDDVRRFPRNIAGAGYRDAEIRLGQGWRVVDPIADKGDPLAFTLQSFDDPSFFFRADFGKNVGGRDSGGTTDILNSTLGVTGNEIDRQPALHEFRHDLFCMWLCRIGEKQRADKS